MSTIKERPILFSALMVRAILEGRKTQTRRVMKVPHKNDAGKIVMEQPLPGSTHGLFRNDQWELWGPLDDEGRGLLYEWGFTCPYGKPGDRLWVREAWQTGDKLDKLNATQIAQKCIAAGYPKPGAPIKYGADGAITVWGDEDALDFGDWGRKRSSRFMPRWASRLTLEITDVRVRRLQEISEEDIAVEGWRKDPSVSDDPEVHRDAARDWYMDIWAEINGNASWKANPWVWALTFKVVA